MNMTILFALIIALAAIHILKRIVAHLIMRKASHTTMAEVQQQAASTTR
jgi:hypothetical protein